MFRVFVYILLFSIFCIPSGVKALMTSTNYTIFADDFNSGIVFNSTTYRLEGTAGESPVGSISSSTYQIVGGYNAMDRSYISLSISSASLDLGTLDVSQVNSAATTVTVTTDDSSGYTLGISSASWTQSSMPNVTGGSVDAGTEEYGFAISGDDVNGALVGIDNIVTAVTLMSSTTVVTNSSSTLTFKASRNSNTVTGVKTQSIILTVSNNL